MLPPLNQAIDALANGPSREALLRLAAPTTAASSSSSRSGSMAFASSRRTSTAKPPPPSAQTSSSVFASPRRATFFKPATPLPTTSTVNVSAQPLKPDTKTAIESLSRIPREFFVVETNAVLPQTQYPPTQYQSTFVGSGTWETVVFPSLTPHTRQQVLYLKQTLDKMLSAVRTPSDLLSAVDSSSRERNLAVIAYIENEWALHSVCFHELARQIKFICKEQSELLFEIQAVYDASMARLLVLARGSDADSANRQRQIEELLEMQRQQQQTLEQERQATATAACVSQVERQQQQQPTCSCGRRRRRRHDRHEEGNDEDRSGENDDEDEDEEDEDEDDDDEDDDDGEEKRRAWRAFQRQRRQLRLRQLGGGRGDNSDAEEGTLRERNQRSSVVEENMAAARVQQAFQKYQNRQAAHRSLQRQEKKVAALDIQRSYRGYKDRQRALHRRAVIQTILKRRKQVAAVELLQLNVRAYLNKKRREEAHSKRTATTATKASVLNAQGLVGRDEHAVAATSTVEAPTETEATVTDRYSVLVTRMGELATSFSLLHSQKRRASELNLPPPEAEDESTTPRMTTVSSAGYYSDGVSAKEESSELHPVGETQLLDETLRQAEDLMMSIRSAISELKREHGGDVDGLSKATSTTALSSSPTPSVDESGDASGEDVPFLFTEDDFGLRTGSASRYRGRSERKVRSAALASTPPGVGTPEETEFGDQYCADDSDDTHLDDVLWQTSVYTARSSEQLEDEATARQLLMQELKASREQQKRHAWLKQFIVDIYDTIVGRLSALSAARRHKLILVHASLALSFADGQRFLRGRRQRGNTTTPRGSYGSVACEYEPVSAFVGRLDLAELIRDHFHCQVGLQHLVDASVERLHSDLRVFMGMDADVQRFHDYLTRGRSLDELVFFCLCRLLARGDSQSRQPAFHNDTLREVVGVTHALDAARGLFYCAGDDAVLLTTDAFMIEPSNEIYQRHQPSRGLDQVEAILKNYAVPVDDDEGVDSSSATFVRASNANQFHAKEYNASAPRSPIVRRVPHYPPSRTTTTGSSSSSTCVFFDEFVDLLSRYRSVMRHFHAFIHWTYELFYDAFRQQQLGTTPLLASSTSPALLEEAAFVATLLPFSLGASERELRNVFHNALKQRHLQRLMPMRVFISVVLVLLRNGLLSVASYHPLERKSGQEVERVGQPLTVASYRHQRQEKQWMQLALQWRGQEKRFEETVERIYAAVAPTTDDDDRDTGSSASDSATQLLQWRNELYELFINRSGRENLERAQLLYESLLSGMALPHSDSIRPVVRAEATDGHAADISGAGDDASVDLGAPWAVEEDDEAHSSTIVSEW